MSVQRTATVVLLAAAVTATVAAATPARAAEPEPADVSVSTTYWGGFQLRGSELSAYVHVDNVNATARDIRFTAPLPRGLVFKKIEYVKERIPWDCTASTAAAIDCRLEGDFEPDPEPLPGGNFPDTVHVFLTVADDAPEGDAHIDVTVTSSTPDSNESNNTSRITVPISTTTGSISGRAFNDLNRDGIQDAGEPGLAGLTVFAIAENGNMEHGYLPTTTDAEGRYSLPKVPSHPGWQVNVGSPQERSSDPYWEMSPYQAGDDRTVDSDFDPEDRVVGTAASKVHTVTDGKHLTLDVGFYLA